MKSGRGVLSPSALSCQNIKPADWRKGCMIWCHYLRKGNVYRFGAENTKFLTGTQGHYATAQGFYGKSM